MDESKKIELKKILKDGTPDQLKALFAFVKEDRIERTIFKFNLWVRKFFPKYLSSADAPFHYEIDEANFNAYCGGLVSFVDIAFRGAAKTARTKLFFAFCLCNDLGHYRKYIKVLAEDGVNSKQITTDIYNMLVSEMIHVVYPNIFEKSKAKREETMGSFTTSFGVKVVSGTVGTDQRGALQDFARPDLIWYEDFENRKTLRSAVKTIAIWDNMEEARTSLAVGGSCIYTCNYLSEQGNVHRIVKKQTDGKKVLIIPIIDKNGVIAWDRYTHADIERMKQEDDDFEGERLCDPAASKDVYFCRESLEAMDTPQPIKISNGFRMYKEYNPSHRYGHGGDIGGGVGLDSSASVFIDFSTFPAHVVGVYANNLIRPEDFGDEMFRQAGFFGNCLVCPERNYGTEAILRLKQLGANIFAGQTKNTSKRSLRANELGWHTNQLTKPQMLSALSKAVSDGLIALNDEALIAELKSYTRNDLIENIRDPRLTTRHFDLLMACAIAWQMKNYAEVALTQEEIDEVWDNLPLI